MDLTKCPWNESDYRELISYLQEQADGKYKEFNERILHTDKPTLGIRTPDIRKMAKEILKGDPQGFLEGYGIGTKGSHSVTPEYHEEKVLIGIVITGLSVPYVEFLKALEDFLPYIDNWAVCDVVCSSITKAIKKNREEYFQHIPEYLESSNPWIIRFGIVSMISQYMDEEYISQCLERIDAIAHTFYYVKIAQAWLVATAMAKQPETTKEYFLSSHLDTWTFNKAIQKSRESFRVSSEDKALLMTWKRKKQ